MPEVTLRVDGHVGLRSCLASVEVVGAVTLAHAAGAASTGEPGPGLGSVLAVAALVLPLTVLVLRHKVSVRLALPLLLAAQLLAHAVLTATHAQAAGHPVHEPWQLTWQMAAAHAAGAVLTALVWHARRRLLEVAVAWPTSYAVALPALPRLAAGSQHIAAASAWTCSHPLRGPPARPARA